MAAKAAEKVSARLLKDAEKAAKQVLKEQKAAERAAKQALKQQKADEKAARDAQRAQKQAEAIKNAQNELDEDELAVEEFVHAGVTYLRSPAGEMFDMESHDPIGWWDESLGAVVPSRPTGLGDAQARLQTEDVTDL